MADRTVGPTALLVALALGVAVGGVAVATLPATPSVAAATLSVDGDRIVLEHRAGDPLDVTRLDVVVRVDGDPLARQPPVPFFSARGFRPGPTGPFNAASDGRWEPGERASVRVASTNRPRPRAGDRVTVELRYRGRRLLTLSATA
jgi:hypothetical protein